MERSGKHRGIRGWRQQGVWLALWVWLPGVALGAEGATNTPPSKPSRGYSYVHESEPGVPWSMHVVKVQLRHPDVELQTAMGRGESFSMALVSDMARGWPAGSGQVVAAVNGDFYHQQDRYPGRPRDLQICRGELVSAPDGHACFWIDAAGEPRMTNVVSRFRVVWPGGNSVPIGLNEERGAGSAVLYTSAVGASTRAPAGLVAVLERGTNTNWLPLAVGRTYAARVREVRQEADTALTADTMVLSIAPGLVAGLPAVVAGMTLQVVTETFPKLEEVKVAIGGGPTLVRDGKAMQWNGLQARHPRSAVGFNRDTVFLVEIDGRQGNISLGMSFPELAAYMQKLGCENAMNLDGGGSATLWVFGNVINSPSEGRERPSANALVVVEKNRRTRRE